MFEQHFPIALCLGCRMQARLVIDPCVVQLAVEQRTFEALDDGELPIEAGLDPQFTIIEGFERSLLYGELYNAWVDDETRLHPTPEAKRDWEVLLEHVGYLFLV